MQRLALVLACLACVGHARRVHRPNLNMPGNTVEEQQLATVPIHSLTKSSQSQANLQVEALSPLEVLTLLLTWSRLPQAGFAGLGPSIGATAATLPPSCSVPFRRLRALHSVPSRSRSLDARMALQRTYIMIKPDGVQRSLVGEIIRRFEQRGYKLQALKLYQASEELLRQHYKDLVDKKFFPSLLSYMLSGPVVCMVWEGVNVVKMGRQMLGATNPQESLPGTIRGDFSIEVGRNICHGSDSIENAEREIKLWFKDNELTDWKSHSEEWIYRDYE